MILIFGGTTEGRISARVCDLGSKPYFYSTFGDDQVLESPMLRRVSGAMTVLEMLAFCKKYQISLIIDAAHPYAEKLHRNIAVVKKLMKIPVIRFEREKLDLNQDSIIKFSSLSAVLEYLDQTCITKLLALTGVKSASSLLEYSQSNEVYLRIMNRDDSLQRIKEIGFPEDRLLFYDDEQGLNTLLENFVPQAILTKESGESGGFNSKLDLARHLDIPLLVIERPILYQADKVVYGENGLRRSIEKIFPDFIELKSGITTGSCATAAASAALMSLLDNKEYNELLIELPDGEMFSIETHSTSISNNSARVSVIKDAGDDPDVTDKIEIIAEVRLLGVAEGLSSPQIIIDGGEGVGRVTLPGIGLEIGEAAINPVPRSMIKINLLRILEERGIKQNVEVIISAVNGLKIAKRTFNEKLGILDGISILGTSGIVKPFSEEAFIDAIARQISIVKALGVNTLVLNSGARSTLAIKSYYPDFIPQAYIHYGNLIGPSIKLAAAENMEKVIIGLMLGKAVKVAAGHLDTHSKHNTMDKEFLKALAKESNCSEEVQEKILSINLASQLPTIVPEPLFFERLKELCYKNCAPLFPNGEIEIILIK